jgi:sulfotransferase
MTRSVHFISGLPRAGSTLLCAILRQNPRFSAAMSSPVAALCLPLIPKMSASGEFAAFFTNDRRRQMLRAVFDAYHADAPPDGVIFDTNRVWTGKAALLADLYPASRIICCVREIGWIIDSIERMLRRNPLEASKIFSGKGAGTLYTRVETLMNSDSGLVGSAWSNLREAWFGERVDRLILISYEGFVENPQMAVRRLYDALGEPLFRHDFENIQYDEPEFDADLGMPGLHHVRARVERDRRLPAIPPDLFAKYAESSFWRPRPGERPKATIVC